MNTEQLIREDAKYFAKNHVEDEGTDQNDLKDVFDELQKSLANYYSPNHKSYFLDQLGIEVTRLFREHEDVCHNPDECAIKPFLTRITFFLNQEIEQLMNK